MSQNITVIEHLESTSNRMQIEDVLDFIDTLHSVASDGELPYFAEMDEAEIMSVLRDIIYTAQETLVELQSVHNSKQYTPSRQQPILHIVPKVDKAG
ncbi:MAG: hypothetical protein WBC91_07090 [Phototrophicaceae bacterium]